VLKGLGDTLWTARVLQKAGIVRPERPDKLVRIATALARWGPTPAAGYTASAIRSPDRPAVIDDIGAVTFSEVDRRTNALANALADAGINEGDGIAIMCRNHRGFIDATVAASKLGANALYLNTAFAGPQIADVVAREKPKALIYDEEFKNLIDYAGHGRLRFVGWSDSDDPGDPTLEQLIAGGDGSQVVPPTDRGRVVILTSGTTGAPKGASRKQPDSMAPAAALFSRIPLRARETTMIAAPMFHSWGFAHFTLVVVPVMLQRIMELPPETIAKYDLPALRVIAASGSTLPGELATKVMDTFGDVLYNLYGSTEVAWATIATPEDLRTAPGTAGKPPHGTVVKLLDENGREVAPGETGRIFVNNELMFEGYTGGGSKDVIDGLMSTGDVGHFDPDGHLFVAGRDDEMIVSGAENVFPREVEDLLATHEAIEDVAVIGVDDEEFGQRLKAFVVKRKGKSLSEDDVRAFVKSNLARYKVPRDVEFVDELPRNATGKVLKRELREREAAPK
jgi:fatty-acyl-CoA synthase